MFKKKTVREMNWIEREGTGGIIDEIVTTTYYLFFIPIYTSMFTYRNTGNYAKEGDNSGIGFGGKK